MIKITNCLRLWPVFASVATVLLGQQTGEQLVRANVPFFEHLFTTIGMASGVHQQAYFDHLRLSDAQAQIVRKLVTQFQAQENGLRKQAETALTEKKPDMAVQLTQIRSQRNQLLVQTGVELLQQLGTDGSNRIKAYMQRIAAALPRRVP